MKGTIVALVTALAVTTSSAAPAVRRLPADPNADVIYVALGDSTVEGVGASSPGSNYVGRLATRLQQRYPRTRLANLGVAGAKSHDVLVGQVRDAIALGPHLVTLSVGPNDITGRVPVESFAKNLDAILGRLTTATEAVIVVNLLPDLAVTPRFRNPEAAPVVGRLSTQFNAVVSRTAKRHGVLVVDLYRASRAEVPRHPELLSADGYHPSDLGYARWAELMWDVVRTRLGS